VNEERGIIATRTLILREQDGDKEVPIHIHAPEQKEGHWLCRYEVIWPDETWRYEAQGHDAVQAIELAFQMIGVQLYVTEDHKAGRLGWEEPGKGYGFPVSRGVRDLLVGDDKRFYGESTIRERLADWVWRRLRGSRA
jgi:hypothetical protein